MNVGYQKAPHIFYKQAFITRKKISNVSNAWANSKLALFESLSDVGSYAIVAVIAKIYVFFKGLMIYRGAITECVHKIKTFLSGAL